MNVRAASLANNHAPDFGEDALTDTVEALRRGRIASAGAGCGTDAAHDAAVVPVGRLHVGLVAVTDHPAQYAAAAEFRGRGLHHASRRRPTVTA